MNDQQSYKSAVEQQLGEVFGTEIPREDLPVIDDMLAWQKMMDEAPASINLRGARRFWLTVARHLGRTCFTDGSPDITQVVIPLTDTVGLQLTADYNKYIAGEHEGEPVLDDDWGVWMDYRFVALDAEKRYTP